MKERAGGGRKRSEGKKGKGEEGKREKEGRRKEKEESSFGGGIEKDKYPLNKLLSYPALLLHLPQHFWNDSHPCTILSLHENHSAIIGIP